MCEPRFKEIGIEIAKLSAKQASQKGGITIIFKEVPVIGAAVGTGLDLFVAS